MQTQQPPQTLLKIRDIIVRLFELEPDDLQPDRNLKDLGIDSLMALDILTEIEGVFAIKVRQDNLRRFTTLESIGALVDEEVLRKTAAAV
jgi:acyl carrier protein